ncbi:MAG: DUF4954 family protein [Marinilabiliaceae bacterium]|nr:DUF4954 family protein [Marinilabiliaceae bacterium]
MHYRNLTSSEISILESQGCFSINWSDTLVTEELNTKHIRNVEFIGANKVSISTSNCDMEPSGIYNCTIKNCTIEDHVIIKNVGIISNYIVRSHAKIENCNSIEVFDNPTFGSGTEVSVINEAGGREVLLYEQLNAPIAHLMAFMQHRPEFIKNLKGLIKERIHQQNYEKGIIGHHAILKNCNTINNIIVGDYSVLTGVLNLQNGTILSCKETQTELGHGVIASNFIIDKGSTVKDSAIIKRSFIGEGCIVERQFSSENSVVFSNSQLYHGEACSAFCAPYTISHHKSSLLIAGYFSFINLGSGSNQSNHMYKLGPVHQGIMERGCKLSSDSYLLWPGKIGAYTFVMGRHYSNPDIADFPFSYLLDMDDQSNLVPGANFRSIGTIRDGQKWPQRDIRIGDKKDPINFKLLNPFIISKAWKGIEKLNNMLKTSPPDKTYYNIGQVKIKKPAAKRGIEIYNEIITLYYGDLLFERCNQLSLSETLSTIAEYTDLFSKENDSWHDLSGLLITKSELESIITDVENKTIKKLSSLEKMIDSNHNEFKRNEWDWAMKESSKLLGFNLSKPSDEQINEFLKSYKSALSTFINMLKKDAQKEFSESSKISFGYDDNIETKNTEFNQIRGDISSNTFINNLSAEIEKKIIWVDSVTL